MDLSSLVWFCAAVSVVRGGWLEELVSPRGYDVGAGLSVRLEEKNVSNSSSFFDNHVLRMDYANYGVSVSKNTDRNSVELELLREDPVKGRGKQQMGNILLPVAVGFKTAAIVAFTIFTLKVLVIKALMVAKLALLISSTIFVKKYFHHKHEPTYVEIEHHGSGEHHPFLSHGDIDEGHAATNYVAYANYAPSAAAQSQIVNYAAVEAAPESNLTGGVQQIVVPIAAKRVDEKKKHKLPLYTIRKYTVHTS